jgi:hypothetical protein
MSEGYMATVKQKVIDLIALADSSLNGTTHVKGNWRLDAWELDSSKLPVVTVRLGTSGEANVYGRNLNSTTKGSFVTFPFSAHVFHSHSVVTNTLKAKKAMDLADKIITYLIKVTYDASSGVIYFYGLTARESEAEGGPIQFSRIIIEGFVVARRPLA